MNNAFRIIFDKVRGHKLSGHAERNMSNIKSLRKTSREVKKMILLARFENWCNKQGKRYF